jgi:hypothetical protein
MPSKKPYKIFLALLTLCLISSCTSPPPDPAIIYQPVLDRYIEAWNSGDAALLDEVCHPDFTIYKGNDFKTVLDYNAVKQWVTDTHAGYPDFKIALPEVLFTSNACIIRWTITATNTGPGQHTPTGVAVKVSSISILHYRDGKLLDEWMGDYGLSWSRQMGYELAPVEVKSDESR